MDRLANNVQTAMDNARGLSGGDRMGAVAGALGSLLALQGLGNGATFEQANGMRMVLATIMHDHFEHKWNDLHRAAPTANCRGDRPDRRQRRLQLQRAPRDGDRSICARSDRA